MITNLSSKIYHGNPIPVCGVAPERDPRRADDLQRSALDPYYTALTASWGLTPLQDQQLAGLIMWVPGSGVFTLLTIGYFAASLRCYDPDELRIPRAAVQLDDLRE